MSGLRWIERMKLFGMRAPKKPGRVGRNFWRKEEKGLWRDAPSHRTSYIPATACRHTVCPGFQERDMRAAVFYDPLKMDVHDDIVEPVLGAGEVLVQVKACGICGSDLHLYRTNAHRGAGVLRVNEQGLEIPGHEYSGVILQVGEGVSGYQAGDRVVGVTGGGAFAERVPVPA